MTVRAERLGRGKKRLPSFKNPPVVEVALAVAFEPLQALDAAHLGVLWQSQYRQAGLTKVEQQPPVQMQVERFGEIPLPTLRVEMVTEPPLPRLWFRNEAGTELVQVQNNWFARNWRKMETAGPYPRYPAVRDSFDEDFRRLRDFVQSEGLGEVEPTQCEVTYVNHILPGESWQGLGSEHEVLRLLTGLPDARYVKKPELTRVNMQHLIPDENGSPVGRLHISAEPAFRKQDKRPMLVLTLTARGKPLGRGFEGTSKLLDLGHEWIVSAFLDTTTARIQEAWGLEHDGS